MTFKMKGFPKHKGVESPIKPGVPYEKNPKELLERLSGPKVDPDAPGTPGTPGYEPPVKRSDLDAEGKPTWDKHRKRKQPTYEGTDEYRDKKDITESEELHRGVNKKGAPKMSKAGAMTDENPDTRGPVKPTVGPATERRKFDHNERINDLEDRIEYLNNDIDELSGDQSRETTAKIKKLIAKRKAYMQKLKILRND